MADFSSSGLAVRVPCLLFPQAEAKDSAPLTVDYVGLQFISGMGVGGLGALLGLEAGSLSSTLLNSIVGMRLGSTRP